MSMGERDSSGKTSLILDGIADFFGAIAAEFDVAYFSGITGGKDKALYAGSGKIVPRRDALTLYHPDIVCEPSAEIGSCGIVDMIHREDSQHRQLHHFHRRMYEHEKDLDHEHYAFASEVTPDMFDCTLAGFQKSDRFTPEERDSLSQQYQDYWTEMKSRETYYQASYGAAKKTIGEMGIGFSCAAIRSFLTVMVDRYLVPQLLTHYSNTAAKGIAVRGFGESLKQMFDMALFGFRVDGVLTSVASEAFAGVLERMGVSGSLLDTIKSACVAIYYCATPLRVLQTGSALAGAKMGVHYAERIVASMEKTTKPNTELEIEGGSGSDAKPDAEDDTDGEDHTAGSEQVIAPWRDTREAERLKGLRHRESDGAATRG